MVLIIDNILTPYEVARYNRINKELHGNLFVWFHTKTEKNRNWKQFPNITFRYHISEYGLFYADIAGFLHTHKKEIGRIVCCGWNNSIYWYALFFSKYNAIRFTLWSGSTLYEKSFLRFLSTPFVRLFVSFCDDFIAYGSRAKEYLQSLGAKHTIVFYYNSVDVDFFHDASVLLKKKKNALRKKYAISNSHTVFVFVGQLIKRKGILELLEAYYVLNENPEAMTLVIVGNGELRDQIQQMIKEHPERSVFYFPHKEYDEMPEIYAISDVLVLPSKEEVWGLVVNEAMASGLPVIVSEHAGCVADLVHDGKNGFICKPEPLRLKTVLSRFLSLSQSQKTALGGEAWKIMKTIYSETHFH